MQLFPTKRENIFNRMLDHDMEYFYFFYEEDPFLIEEADFFGYSKFVTDECYSDNSVAWNYIVVDGRIVGIAAIDIIDDVLNLKFVEIAKRYQGNGFGSLFLDFLKNRDNKNYSAIVLYPKNDDVANNFYKPNGFKYIGDEMTCYC